jgi:hypothetical protein
MSRAYRIKVSESLRRHVRVEDGVCSALELLEVLPREAMIDLLARELEGRGYVRRGDEAVRQDADGVEVAIDLNGGTVTIRLTKEADLTATVTGSRVVTDPNEHSKESLREDVRKSAEGEIDTKREELREEVTRRLESRLRDLQQELDQVSQRVTAEALKVRARQLGEIEEMTEDPETGSMTIKVRL